MQLRLRGWFCGFFGLLSLAACRVDGKTSADANGPALADDLPARCAEGDPEAGARLVEASRDALAEPAGLAQVRGQLDAACTAGCAPTCLELGRLGFDREQVRAANAAACQLGDALGCELAGELSLDAAAALCDRGELQGCARALALGIGSDGREQLEQRVMKVSLAACEAGEPRACGLVAWSRCAGLGVCDGAAVEAASFAAARLPEPALVELLALAQCRSGSSEDADATLANACAAGQQQTCGRTCEGMLGTMLLVREAERDRVATVVLHMQLQNDASSAWYAALSVMDADELAGFATVLAAFVPPISEPASKVEVSADLRARYPTLIESILRSPQLDKKQIRYWLERLPEMTEEQRDNLLDSLRKQWWMIPGEPDQTPQAHVDRVRASKAALSGWN